MRVGRHAAEAPLTDEVDDVDLGEAMSSTPESHSWNLSCVATGVLEAGRRGAGSKTGWREEAACAGGARRRLGDGVEGAGGVLILQIDHLTPYTLGRP